VIANSELVYVLHTRNFRETSQLVDLFSREEGRFRVVARGTRAHKKRAVIALQPFVPYFASWQGRGDLKTLMTYEPAGAITLLRGEALYVGLYINELLSRLLPEYIPHEMLFERYQGLIDSVDTNEDREPTLRDFELLLLDELGYGINLHTDAVDGSALKADAEYIFQRGEGFTRTLRPGIEAENQAYLGAHLQAIANRHFASKAIRLSAKRLIRTALAQHLGGRPLHSRELMRQLKLSNGSNP
jgi:DNA repair protein RecO (recombination protein O)